ncbi:OmpW/AlkL family protein [Paraburkholderia bannensis]|uniref:OmpW/AlkL family protein n=1 Tax=Paraburkholderia bannensis TaxID=765414 RepID=UPI002AC33536|nr:OmpW family outer membrane protein [Paraburkholderia bannensis]
MLKRFNMSIPAMVLAMSASPMAFSQSVGSFVASLGPAWIDFGRSRATELQSQSPFGTFTSAGTDAQVHNVVTPELTLSYFVTDNIALEAILGVPPKLNLYAQGNVTPLGSGGPALQMGDLHPFATARAWAPILLAKYFLGAANNRFRPFIGAGVNYTWFSAVQLNPNIAGVLTQFGGPGGHAEGALSNSWNPVFSLGASYQISDRWYMTASATYLPLVTHAHFNAVSQSGQTTLTNSSKITGDPIAVFVGIGYRF